MAEIRILVAAASLLAAAAPPAVGAEAPIRAVTLSSAGLAEIARTIPADVDAIELFVRRRDLDDALKSLLVTGEGIAGARLVLDGPGAIEDLFEALPFGPQDVARLDALLARLPGARVAVAETRDAAPLTGRVMGVSRSDAAASEGAEPPAILLLMVEDELVRVTLGPGARVRLLDEDVARDVGRALAALEAARGEAGRRVRVSIARDPASPPRPASLSAVLAAPRWKAAYRAVLSPGGAVAVEAWAIVENATGEDWDGVRLTLAAGSPRTLEANLFARSWAFREAAPEGGAPGRAPFSAMVGARAEALDVAPSPAPAFAPTPAEASEGDVGARFVFPDPVSLRAGEMTATPFLAGAIEARAVSRHVGGAPGVRAPALALDLRNDLPVRLPPGVLTLYDGDGHVGDAALPELGPGETRAVAFAQDTKTIVEEERGEGTRAVRLVVRDGLAVLEDEEERLASYRVRAPADAARAVVIDHPATPGWRLAVLSGGPAPRELLVDRAFRAHRFVLALGPGEETRLRLRETRPLRTSVRLGDVGEEQILAWSGREMSDADRALLARLAEARREIAAVEEEIRRLDDERARLGAEQERMRGLMAAMPEGSAPRARYLDAILALESRLDGALDARAAAEDRRAEARARLAGLIGG